MYEGRISCRHLLPFMLAQNQLAFKAFSELTNNVGDDSIDLLTESDPAIDCLMNALDSEPLCRMSLEIICNLLGEGQGHWKLFMTSNLLDKCASLLLKGDRNLKRAVLKMLCNFVFEGGAATAVLRHHNLPPFLVRTELGLLWVERRLLEHVRPEHSIEIEELIVLTLHPPRINVVAQGGLVDVDVQDFPRSTFFS